MTCSTSLSGKNRIVLIAGILMIATTLRVTFTGAAPLLDTIRSAYSLTTAQTGLLTTLPLLAFALISPLAAPVARRFGMERSLFAALLLICAGIAIRSLPSPYLLFGGTAIIGGGIALGNVLLPGLIKRDFPHSVARLTGAYSLTMGAAAALGSAMVVPLALNGFGWRGALLMLMCFPLLALFLWLPQWRSQQHANLSTSRALHTRGIWRSPLAWQVTLFLGIFRQLTSSELSLYQQSPYNPLYIRISLYPEVNRYHPISSCFWGYFRGYYFLLKYQHPHNGKNVIYNNDF